MLKRQNCYLLKQINDTYWLLPYGQAVADQKKGCQLNETGVFIWQALEHPMSEDQLIQNWPSIMALKTLTGYPFPVIFMILSIQCCRCIFFPKR